MLDGATFSMALLDGEADAAATLAHRMGSQAAAHLCRLFRFRSDVDTSDMTESDAAEIRETLRHSGFKVLDGPEPLRRLIALRGDYVRHTAQLRAHFGA